MHHFLPDIASYRHHVNKEIMQSAHYKRAMSEDTMVGVIGKRMI
jgi:hypothetical protein